MKLRKFKRKDAPLMLEWMHDQSVVEHMKKDFSSMKLKDCNAFITSAKEDTGNLHLAIVDDNDEYMGTVSLKHIFLRTAEFAITIRKCAMGRGFAQFGMSEILKEGFENLKLRSIYWNVDPVNQRAVHFYEKQGFEKFNILTDGVKEIVKYQTDIPIEELTNYIWFCAEN